uniref:Uncharacterized protein n=1 Tax=Octopus bimaculoides TaxID=37653 RepID=A0A0L8G516_OCTBM
MCAKVNNKKSKRKTYTISQKLEVLNHKKKNPLATQEELKKKFKMSIGVINSILKTNPNTSKKKKRSLRKEEFSNSECYKSYPRSTLSGFRKKRSNFHTVTNEILKITSLKIADCLQIKDFKASQT